MQPTTATLRSVLDLYAKSGERRPSPADTWREVDTFRAFGETGSISEVGSGEDFADTEQLGPVTQAWGRRSGQRWREDENGYVRPISGAHDEDLISERALQGAEHGGASPDVALLGVVDDPVHAYVVEVKPPDGRHEWVFIDRASGRLVRIEASHIDRRLVWTYDDFRTTGGIVSPWHVHYSDGYPDNEQDWTVRSLDRGVAVSPAELAIPASKSRVLFPPGVAHVRLPARIESGMVIVRLEIGGRGLDFQLDSGAYAIGLDAGVARQLGLQTFGTQTDEVAGAFPEASAIVPEIKIGDLTMPNVVVHTIPFSHEADTNTKIVGLLGYDFLAGAVAEVDYADGTVDAYDPATFKIPAGRTATIPLVMDDAIPRVAARVGDRVAGRFIVDTGSPIVALFSTFLDQHGEDLNRSVIFPTFGNTLHVHMQGVGGTLQATPAVIKSMEFGGATLNSVFAFTTKAAPSFEGEDTDGLIGYDLLRFFNVYFDYADSRLLLQPNASFHGSLEETTDATPSPAPSAVLPRT